MEKRFKSVPIRSKPGLGIRITKREANFDQEAKIPVKQTQISAFRSQATSKTNTMIENRSTASALSTSRKIYVQPQSESQVLNNTALINLRNSLMSSHDYSNVSTRRLEQLISHLRLYSTDCILNRDYDEAEKADDLAIEVKSVIQDRKNEVSSGLSEDAEAEVHNHLDRCIAELDAFDNQTAQKREELERKQEEELAKFDQKWREEYPRKYRKPSTKLLLMIENERKVGFQGNYKLAREMKAKTDEQRRIEAEAAQERLEKDYIAAREKFMEKQVKERDQFNITRADNRQIIVSRQEVEFKSTINRTKVLSIKEQHQGRIRRDALYPENKGSAAQLLKQHNNEILLPPLTPPDFKEIRQKEAERNKVITKRHKETEERIHAKEEEKRKVIERIAQNIVEEEARKSRRNSGARSAAASKPGTPERSPRIVTPSTNSSRSNHSSNGIEVKDEPSKEQKDEREVKQNIEPKKVEDQPKEEKSDSSSYSYEEEYSEEEEEEKSSKKVEEKKAEEPEKKEESKKVEEKKAEENKEKEKSKSKGKDEYSYYEEDGEEEEYSYYSDETSPM